VISATSRGGEAAVTEPDAEYRTMVRSSQVGLKVNASNMQGSMARWGGM